MTGEAFYRLLEETFSPTLCAAWDNDGAACLPEPEREITRVLVALDATDKAVERATDGGFDLLLTHHPLLFRGVKSLTPYDVVPAKLLKLARAGVAALSYHTRLDAAEGGVNDALCDLFGIENAIPFGPEGEVPCGRVGSLKAPVDAKEFAATVCRLLGTDAVRLAGEGEVQKIAVLGGEGDDFVDAARAAGADLFLSGHIGYHRMLDAAEAGLVTIEAGHYETEYPVLARLAATVRKLAGDVEVEIMPTRVIETVLA